MNKTTILWAACALFAIGCQSKSESTITYDTSSSVSQNATAPAPSQQPGMQTTQQPASGESQPGGAPGAITVGPMDPAKPNPAASLPPMPKEGPTLAKAPTPELAPNVPPASAMRKHGDTTISPTGLKFIDMKPGSGPTPKPGESVTVAYVGKLTNGHQFDASTSFTTQIGVGAVIPGWDEGMLTMKKGGKRRFIIPPALAYGPRGMPPTIPPNATLVFDVDLLLIQQ